jgi:hypothetical protein
VAESNVAQAAQSSGLTSHLSCPACGYWNAEGADFCLDCGKSEGEPETMIAVPALPLKAKLIMFGGVAALALLAYYFPCLTIILFFAAGYGYHRLRLWRAQRVRAVAIRRSEMRVTLRGEENFFKRRRDEIITGMGEFDALLRDGSVLGEDREATVEGNSKLEHQLLNVNSRLNEIAFLRWQNQVEAAALVVGNLTGEYDGDTARLKQEVFGLFEQGERIAAFWKRKGGTEMYRGAAREFLPRIETLREACIQIGTRLNRLKVLHAFRHVKAGAEDVDTGVTLLDNEAAADTADTIIDLTRTHIDEQLMIERLRVGNLGDAADGVPPPKQQLAEGGERKARGLEGEA